MEQLRIAMILSTKFPTIKAYGVTTRETAKVLISKSHDVKIFAYMEITPIAISKSFRKIYNSLIKTPLIKIWLNMERKVPKYGISWAGW